MEASVAEAEQMGPPTAPAATGGGFSDLCSELKAGVTSSQVVATSKRLHELGYRRVAWDIAVHGLAGVKGLDKKEKSLATMFQGGGQGGVEWLRRVTVIVEDVNEAQFLKGTIRLLQRYDLVAARPTTDAAMAFLCESADVDLISLDLAIRPPVQLNPQLVEKAVKRGLLFELRYGPVMEEAPGTKRQQLMSTIMSAVETLRGGKHVVLTSGLRGVDALLRGPHDVMNLAIVMGMKEEHAYSALSKACDRAVGHARARQLEWTPIEMTTIDTASGAKTGDGGGGSGTSSEAAAAAAVPMDLA